MKENNRLLSLDALRGFDMLFIMGFSSFVIALCSLFPGGADCLLVQTMKHVEWHGLAHHDTIFPLFLFLAGVSFPFSYVKSLAVGATTRQIYLKIAKRALLLILFGLIYNGLFKLDFEHLRVCSVLGRIGVAWAVAAVLYMNFGRLSRAVICTVILLVYYFIVCYLPAPDVEGADPLTMQGTIVGYIDRLITPGRLIYDNGRFDPEGLFSTLPAVVSAMLGIFAGEYVRSEKYSGSRKTLIMLLAAAVMLVVGLLWSIEFPINKKLWSSSFVLVVGAYSLAMCCGHWCKSSTIPLCCYCGGFDVFCFALLYASQCLGIAGGSVHLYGFHQGRSAVADTHGPCDDIRTALAFRILTHQCNHISRFIHTFARNKNDKNI